MLVVLGRIRLPPLCRKFVADRRLLQRLMAWLTSDCNRNDVAVFRSNKIIVISVTDFFGTEYKTCLETPRLFGIPRLLDAARCAWQLLLPVHAQTRRQFTYDIMEAYKFSPSSRCMAMKQPFTRVIPHSSVNKKRFKGFVIGLWKALTNTCLSL